MKQFLFLIPILFWVTTITFADDEATRKSIERRQKAEFMSFFLKDAGQADLPKVSLAIQAYNKAVGYYQANEFVLSRTAANEALSHDDLNPLIYELLGDLDNREQKLKEAKANYQIAYSLRPSKSLKEKIEKLAKETKIDKKLSTYKEQHFIIKYNNEEKRYEGFELREMLRKTYRQISKDFGFYFNHQIVVLLLDEVDFKKMTNMPHWVAGVYDGKVRMPLNRFDFNDKELKAITTHEVTHAFVAAMSAMRAPAWINEGLAEYEENQIREVDTLVFDSAVATNTLFSLDQLMAQDTTTTITDTLKVSLFYQQSFKLTQYLVKRYKMFKIKEMLAAYGKGKNSDEVVREVLKISIARLEKEWLATLKK